MAFAVEGVPTDIGIPRGAASLAVGFSLGAFLIHQKENPPKPLDSLGGLFGLALLERFMQGLTLPIQT